VDKTAIALDELCWTFLKLSRRAFGVGAMPTNPFREQGAFEPEATAVMGEAFDASCEELCEVGQLQMVRKLIAQRIIAAARKGELDPVHLRSAALSGLPLSKMSPAA
jgi:hypothetical protein